MLAAKPADHPHPGWGLGIDGNVVCGAGWYYSDGTGMALQNGQWLGSERYVTNAGESGSTHTDD